MRRMRTGRPRSVSDEAIYDAVSAVVTKVGPAGLTLAAVAKHVGLSAPALTQRFGTKRNLLVSYATAQANGLDELFDRVRSSSPTAIEAVKAVLLAFTGGIDSRAAIANNLAFLHLDLTDPELGAQAAEQSQVLKRRLRELLESAVDQGELKKKVDAEVLADTLYTVYNGALVTWAIDGRGPLADWLSERLDRVLAFHRRP